MTAQRGSQVLLQVGNGGSPTETFATIGGLKIARMEVQQQLLNASDMASGQWRKLLSAAGGRSMTISGSGLFTDSASEELVRSAVFDSTARNYRFTFPNGDKVTGPFMVAAYRRAGEMGDEEAYAISLENSGELTFTAG